MEVKNSQFSAFIDGFTPNTYVMVIMSDSSIREYFSIATFTDFLLTAFFYFSLCRNSSEHSKFSKTFWKIRRRQELVSINNFIL